MSIDWEKRRRAQQRIEAAVDAIKWLPEEDHAMWISFAAEALESELGETALQILRAAIEKRLEHGEW